MRITRSIVALSVLAAAIVACGSGKSKPKGPPGPTTIHGTVRALSIDGFDSALPAVGVVVLTSGQTPVVTGSAGGFTLEVAKTPYDLTVIDATTKRVIVWKGLTRGDPVIAADVLFGRQGTVTGNVTGGTPGRCDFAAAGIGGFGFGCSTPFSRIEQWAGPATLAGKMYSLNVTGADGSGTFGSAPATLSDGNSVNADIAVAVVAGGAPTSIAVSGVQPSQNGQAAMFFSDAGVTAIGVDATNVTTDGTISMTPPSLPGNTFDVQALLPSTVTNGFQLATVRAITAGASGLSISFAPLPQLALPVPGASGVTVSTPFSWQSSATNTVYLVSFLGPLGEPAYRVVTTSTTTTIPDLAAEGLPLRAGTSYSWFVDSFGPFATIDAAAATGLAAPPSGPWFDSSSGSRLFATP